MTILQTKFYPIPVVIEIIAASAHILPTMHILPRLTLHKTIRLKGKGNEKSTKYVVMSKKQQKPK